MDSRKMILKDTTWVTLGILVCSGVMVGLFAVFGKFSVNVILSALVGSFVIALNYLFMAITVSMATQRAASGEVEQAKKSIQLSSAVRLVCMGVILLAGIKLGANVIALVLPLVFLRPVLMVTEFFRKKVT